MKLSEHCQRLGASDHLTILLRTDVQVGSEKRIVRWLKFLERHRKRPAEETQRLMTENDEILSVHNSICNFLATDNRRLFCTGFEKELGGNYYIGVSTREARPGDQVLVLPGLAAQLIVRQDESRDGAFGLASPAVTRRGRPGGKFGVLGAACKN